MLCADEGRDLPRTDGPELKMNKHRSQKRKVWDWFTRITAVVAFVLAVVNFYIDRTRERSDRALVVRQFYDRAWDALGGVEGTVTLDEGATKGNTGARQRAMNLVNQGLAIAPNDPELLATKGLIFAEYGNTREAEAFYRRALALKPKDVVAHNGLAFILQDRGNYEAAIALYRQALDLRPDEPWAVYLNLGTAFQEIRRFGEAEAAFRSAITLRNDYAEAYARLADVLAAQNKNAEARLMRARASALNAARQSS